jgi:hypothetical protein
VPAGIPFAGFGRIDSSYESSCNVAFVRAGISSLRDDHIVSRSVTLMTDGRAPVLVGSRHARNRLLLGVDTSPRSAHLIVNLWEMPCKRFQNGDAFA